MKDNKNSNIIDIDKNKQKLLKNNIININDYSENKNDNKDRNLFPILYKKDNIFCLNNYDFEFDESLLNPSNTFMNEEELKQTQKKTARDFFSSSSASEDEKALKVAKKKVDLNRNENQMKHLPNQNCKTYSDESSISEFSSDIDKQKKTVNLLNIYNKKEVKKHKHSKEKIAKYKIKNKFIFDDLKKYTEKKELEKFEKINSELNIYSAEAITKKFNKLKNKKKQKKFLERFQLRNIKFDKSDLFLTIDLNKEKDFYRYGAMQMKDVPIFHRCTKSKIIGIKNEKKSIEILKDLNFMTGQFDPEYEEQQTLKNKNKKLRYFAKNFYTKSLLNETQNPITNSIYSTVDKKKEQFKNNLYKKIQEGIKCKEYLEINPDCHPILNANINTNKIISEIFEDINLVENMNFEILFEKFFKKKFNQEEYINEELVDTKNRNKNLNENIISFENSKKSANIADGNFNKESEAFFSNFDSEKYNKLLNHAKKVEDDPLSLDIDFEQISANEKNFLLKNSEFNRKLANDPDNILLWIEYINYQDELFVSNPSMFKNEKNKLEIKINIIEKAMKIDSNKKNYTLNILRLRILNRLHSENFDQVNLYWMMAFDSFFLEKSFLNEYLLTLKKQPKLTISDLKDFYLALIKFYELKISRLPKEDKNKANLLTKFVIDIIFDLVFIDKNAGYLERSFSLLRAFVEVKILEFKNILSTKFQNYTKEYEEYFESGYPKIGDISDSKGFLDYKDKKFKISKNFFLEKKDFIDNLDIIKIINENANYIKNNKIFCYRPLNSILDYERLENNPDDYIFYSDIKDFVEAKIKLNSELLIYMISKLICYFTGFEIDDEICFTCKKNFVYETPSNGNERNISKISNQIFFLNHYLIEKNPSFKIRKNIQLFIYIIRIFQYLDDMNINKREIKMLEMNFYFMINHYSLKEKLFVNKDKLEANMSVFPFVDITQYAKNLFKNKENQNNIDLWINYYNWLMIYEKTPDAEKILTMLNLKQNSDLKFEDKLKIKLTILNHYFYGFINLNIEEKYNNKELINIIFNTLELINDSEKGINQSLNEEPTTFIILDKSCQDENFFNNFNKNYLRLISQYEKADAKLNKYMTNFISHENNLTKNIFAEFSLKDISHYISILFLSDFMIKYLKLQSELYNEFKTNRLTKTHKGDEFENYLKLKKNILIKSFMTHYVKIKQIENFIKSSELQGDETLTNKFKIKKINCEHFLTQEYCLFFFKFFYFLYKKCSIPKESKNATINNSSDSFNLFIGENSSELLTYKITPLLNIKILKLLNFCQDNKNDFFIFLICQFLKKFDNPIDRDYSFLSYFGDNMSLKHVYYFLKAKTEQKYLILSKMRKQLKTQNFEDLNQAQTFNNEVKSKLHQLNISQIFSMFKDFMLKADFHCSKLKRNFKVYLEENKNIIDDKSRKETLFILNQHIEPEIFNLYWQLILNFIYNFIILTYASKNEIEENLISKFSEYILYVNHEFSLNILNFNQYKKKIHNLINIIIGEIDSENFPSNNLIEFTKGNCNTNKDKLRVILESLENTNNSLDQLIACRDLKKN